MREALGKLSWDGKEIFLFGVTNYEFKDSKHANTIKLKVVYSEYKMG